MALLDFLGLGAQALGRARAAKDEGLAMRQQAEQQSLLDRLKQEQEAQDREQRRRLTEAQIRNYESLARDRSQPSASATPAAGRRYDPVRGVIVDITTGEAIVPENLPERPQTERAPRRQVVGGAIVDIDTGTARPIEGLPEGGADRVSAATRTQLAENTASLDLIARAREAVRARPESFGLARGVSLLPGMGQLGEVINQRTDPEGVAARQLVGNLSSRLIKDRSGAAVTVSEFPRLAAFIPQPYDTPEKILANLDALERELQVVNEALANGATLAELGAAGSASATPAPPRSAAPAQPAAPPPDFEAWRRSRRPQ